MTALNITRPKPSLGELRTMLKRVEERTGRTSSRRNDSSFSGTTTRQQLDGLRERLAEKAQRDPSSAAEIEQLFERAANMGWNATVVAAARRLLADG